MRSSVLENPLEHTNDIRVGNLSVRLAKTPSEIEAAQTLRYHIFYEEMKGAPSEEVKKLRRDFDIFDPYCDHVLVIDHDISHEKQQVVGTYRLLRRETMQKLGHFYSETEFNISVFICS